MFGDIQADEITIAQEVNNLGSVVVLKRSPNINIYSINGIKVDRVRYLYPWIGPLIVTDKLRLADAKDIGAMKLAAITGRGSKKDFYDLYFLLQHYKLTELLDFYNQKYHDGSVFLVLKSLIYFEDAEEDPDPVLLISLSKEVKKKIIELHKAYIKSM